MKPTFVTGATGFVGWHVARLLIEKGHRVRALVRPGRTVPELEVETVEGDLRDRASLERGMAGCGVAFHVAADYRLWAPNPAELFETNVGGTVNMLEAARDCGLDRLVYTSTVGCIGFTGDRAGTEDAPTMREAMAGPYKRSKYEAELRAIEFCSSGFPVIIVNPTAPVGDHDFKPTPTGKIIVDFLRGRMPAYVDTGLNLVDVEDVAEGHWLALERGRKGERYILGGENLTLKAIFDLLASVSGRPAPSVEISYAVAYLAGWISTAWAKLTKTEPAVPLDAVRMAAKKMWVSHAKAAEHLGYRPRPALEGLRRAVDWFRANGYT